MNKTFISTRELVKKHSSIKKGDGVYIVMNHTQPKSILIPYDPKIEKEIEIIMEKLSLQFEAEKALAEHNNGSTKNLDQVKAELNI